jgi:pimeloyl-ACP methyl ester carboxylesterase
MFLIATSIMCMAPIAMTASTRKIASTSQSSPVKIACSQLTQPNVTGAAVISFSAGEKYNNTIIDPQFASLNVKIDVCEVNITLTHPGVQDRVVVRVWMPLNDWNGRFYGEGGGGWLAGLPYGYGLLAPVSQGFAAASTDGGNLSIDAMALLPKVLPTVGDPDLALLADFSTRSLHEMAVIGKTVTKEFYGRDFKSYFDGCSNGGRQAYQLAQKYPEDYDGILGIAPALYWPSFFFLLNWGHFLMNSLDYFPTQCEFDGYRDAVIEACDILDGVQDGIISDVNGCVFNFDSLIGRQVSCQNSTVTLTKKGAEIVRRIREGPRTPSGLQLWDGFDYGIDYFGGMLTQTLTVNGATVDSPLVLADSYFKFFIVKNTSIPWSSVRTVEQFLEYYAISYPQYGGIISADDPDLAPFRDSGGKLLTWHGLGDPLIPHNQTLRYRRQVEKLLGGYDAVNAFYRIFLAPGAGHCNGGYGPVPDGPISALVDWVENGNAPETITSSFIDITGSNVSRPLCPWPLVARYDGTGDFRSPSSFSCADSY